MIIRACEGEKREGLIPSLFSTSIYLKRLHLGNKQVHLYGIESKRLSIILCVFRCFQPVSFNVKASLRSYMYDTPRNCRRILRIHNICLPCGLYTHA